MDWFKAGGYGMILITLVGLAGMAAGARAYLRPTENNLRVLRATPAILLGLALFSFGTGLWKVGSHVDEGINSNILFMGVFEAAQCLTLGGLLAAVIGCGIVVAESRRPKTA